SEMSVAREIEQIRQQALNNHDSEIQSYRDRIASARSDTSDIKLKIQNCVVSLRGLEASENHHLDVRLRRVQEYQVKLDAFRTRLGITGLPNQRGSTFWFVITGVFMLAIESLLNGMFFARHNELGQIGGIGQAMMISAINIMIGAICGLLARHRYLRTGFGTLIGWLSIVAWVVLSVGFNLLVAHFRDALDMMSWDAAMQSSVGRVVSEPWALGSLESVILLLAGLIVSLLSFYKTNALLDPVPGFNKLWDAVENSINDYAEAYEASQQVLKVSFQEQKEDLRKEVRNRREELRNAVSALNGQGSLVSNLETFLVGLENDANQLMRIYREANMRHRTADVPAYFDEMVKLERPANAETDANDTHRAEVEVQIVRMEELMTAAVERLSKAQTYTLKAFPTLEDIRAGRTERKAREDDTSLQDLLEPEVVSSAEVPHAVPKANSDTPEPVFGATAEEESATVMVEMPGSTEDAPADPDKGGTPDLFETAPTSGSKAEKV
ncbi:hypothetical protein HC022_14080, partial [Salipiger sp. HF18]|uniref:hypothetical protein n=1 Tax=Salipiger sp. HF18 TaxID=2721557 RepID=UPI00169E6D00